MRILTTLITIFVAANTASAQYPNYYPQNNAPQPYAPQYPQPYVAVVPAPPQNNLQAETQMRYQLEATRNLQLRNNAIEQNIGSQLYKMPQGVEANNAGGFEIVE